MTTDDKYKDFLDNKISIYEYKAQKYPKIFERYLTEYVVEQGYEYSDFKQMMNMNFDYQYTEEGLMNLLTYKHKLGDHIENYINLVDSKLAGMFYLFLVNIPSLHEDTINNIQQLYRVHTIELEQKFKCEMKLSELKERYK